MTYSIAWQTASTRCDGVGSWSAKTDCRGGRRTNPALARSNSGGAPNVNGQRTTAWATLSRLCDALPRPAMDQANMFGERHTEIQGFSGRLLCEINLIAPCFRNGAVIKPALRHEDRAGPPPLCRDLTRNRPRMFYTPLSTSRHICRCFFLIFV